MDRMKPIIVGAEDKAQRFHNRIGFDPGEYAQGPVPRVGTYTTVDAGGHPDIISGFQVCRKCFGPMKFKEKGHPVIMMLRAILVTECHKCGHTQAIELRLP
jgi:hypothetical protein